MGLLSLTVALRDSLNMRALGNLGGCLYAFVLGLLILSCDPCGVDQHFEQAIW